jgi:hypothetical protein
MPSVISRSAVDAKLLLAKSRELKQIMQTNELPYKPARLRRHANFAGPLTLADDIEQFDFEDQRRVRGNAGASL